MSVNSMVVSSNATEVRFSGLVPYTTYECFVTASTSVGESNFSTIVTARTDEAGRLQWSFIVCVWNHLLALSICCITGPTQWSAGTMQLQYDLPVLFLPHSRTWRPSSTSCTNSHICYISLSHVVWAPPSQWCTCVIQHHIQFNRHFHQHNSERSGHNRLYNRQFEPIHLLWIPGVSIYACGCRTCCFYRDKNRRIRWVDAKYPLYTTAIQVTCWLCSYWKVWSILVVYLHPFIFSTQLLSRQCSRLSQWYYQCHHQLVSSWSQQSKWHYRVLYLGVDWCGAQ